MYKSAKLLAFTRIESLLARTGKIAISLALLLVTLMLASSVASADTFDVSAVVGNITGGGPGTATGLTLTGTLDIDTVAGTLISGSLTLQNNPNVFTGFFGCPTAGTCTYYFNSGFVDYGLLGLTNTGTLVGYAGTPAILAGSYVYTSNIQFDLTGTVTPVSQVPEPSSLMLLGSGVAAVFTRIRRKLSR